MWRRTGTRMVLQLDDFALCLIHLLDSVGAPDAWSYSVFFSGKSGRMVFDLGIAYLWRVCCIQALRVSSAAVSYGPSQQFFTSALSVMLHKGICVAMLFFYLNDVSVTVLHDYATSSSKENGFAKTIFLRAPTPFLT